MPIPSVPAENLHAALARFDRELRDTPDWAGWESNKAHLYAIEHDGQRYPIKQIVSMATGLPVSEFSGGQAPGGANAYVTARGLGFAIPYFHNGQPHDYVPDFIIRLAGDGARYLIIETKGHDELAEVKEQAASRWTVAVNADGKHGTWHFAMVRRVGDVRDAITAASEARASSMR